MPILSKAPNYKFLRREDASCSLFYKRKGKLLGVYNLTSPNQPSCQELNIKIFGSDNVKVCKTPPTWAKEALKNKIGIKKVT